MKYLFLAIGLFSSLAVYGATQAPLFKLPDIHGSHTFSLKKYRGKVVYLDFWASWCKPCRESMPVMNELYKKHRSKGFEVLAINLDEDINLAKAFLNEVGVSFVVLHDKNQLTPIAYDIDAMPSSVLIDRYGNIRYNHRGFKAKDKAALEKKITDLLEE